MLIPLVYTDQFPDLVILHYQHIRAISLKAVAWSVCQRLRTHLKEAKGLRLLASVGGRGAFTETGRDGSNTVMRSAF